MYGVAMIKHVDCRVIDSSVLQEQTAAGASYKAHRNGDSKSRKTRARSKKWAHAKGKFHPEILEELLQAAQDDNGQFDKLRFFKKLAQYFAFDIPPLGLILDLYV